MLRQTTPPGLGRRPASLATVIGLAIAMLGGCSQFWLDSGAWDVDGHRGLLLKISDYYHRHATEEGGRCRSPILDGVTAASVVEERADSLKVAIRYRYRDFLRDDDDCDPKWRPLRCTIHRQCRGVAARSFEVAKTESGYAVVGMSGGDRP